MLETVVQLALQMQRDEQSSDKTLRHRDRMIGKTLVPLKSHPERQLTAWLGQVSTEADRTQARYATRAQHIVVLLLLLLGLGIGSGAAAAAFYYNGQQPINILPILAVFVVLPLLMLLPFFIAAAPSAWVRALPLMSSLSESLAMILAVIMSGVTRILPQPYREALQEAAGRQEAYRRVYGRMQKWMLLSWSQTFTLAFVLGALLWFGYRLVVTDLAFAWGTTLQTEQPDTLYTWMQRLTDTLAMPWSGALPKAQPTAELIRDTHYFRFRGGVLPSTTHPGALGGWWPFLMMSMVVYGLVPRLLTLTFCAWRYRQSGRWCLLHTPGVADVLDRLNTAMIETESPTAEATPAMPTGAELPLRTDDIATHDRVPRDRAVQTLAQAVLINWSAVPVTDEGARQLLHQAFELDIPHVFHAGGAQTLDEDAGVISQAAQTLQSETAASSNLLLVLVKAWEPPVMDVVDFLGDLRQALGDGVRIRVVPLWIPHDESERDDAADIYIEQWQHKMATLGDPWLSVRIPEIDANLLAANGKQEQSDE